MDFLRHITKQNKLWVETKENYAQKAPWSAPKPLCLKDLDLQGHTNHQRTPRQPDASWYGRGGILVRLFDQSVDGGCRRGPAARAPFWSRKNWNIAPGMLQVKQDIDICFIEVLQGNCGSAYHAFKCFEQTYSHVCSFSTSLHEKSNHVIEDARAKLLEFSGMYYDDVCSNACRPFKTNVCGKAMERLVFRSPITRRLLKIKSLLSQLAMAMVKNSVSEWPCVWHGQDCRVETIDKKIL